MIQCTRAKLAKQVRVKFVLPASEPQGRLAVAGDFNNWDPTATRFRKQGDERVAAVTVDAGRRYAFRYVADGERWFNDGEADAYEPNEFGEMNCVIDLTDGG